MGKWETINQPYDFKCEVCGHEWETWGSNVLTKRNSGCPNCADIRTSIGHKNYFSNKLREDFGKYGKYYSEYRLIVDRMTYRTNKKYLNFDNNRQNHIDHKFSVREAYEKMIDPIIVAFPLNLRIITREENLSKGKKSCITEEELYNMFDKWIKTNQDYLEDIDWEINE